MKRDTSIRHYQEQQSLPGLPGAHRTLIVHVQLQPLQPNTTRPALRLESRLAFASVVSGIVLKVFEVRLNEFSLFKASKEFGRASKVKNE